MPLRLPDRLPAIEFSAGREHLRAGRGTCRCTGHTSPAHRHPQPHAPENHHRDGPHPTPLEHTAAARDTPHEGQGAHQQEHTHRTHAGLLPRLRGHAPREVRRHDHHRSACGAPRLQGGDLLGRDERHPHLGPHPRDQHDVYLLGSPGRALLPLRCAQVPAPAEDVRHLPAGAAPAPPAHLPRLRRHLLHAPQPPHRNPKGRHTESARTYHHCRG